MTDNNISDEELRRLWLDTDFPGHFSGILYFQHCLEKVKGVKVSTTRIKSVLNSIENYNLHVQGKKKGPRRHYVATGFGQLVQGDLAVMWKYKTFENFVLVTDVFSMNIYTRLLRNKTAVTMREALKDIFENDMKMFPRKFETDQGGEFNAKEMKTFYKNNGIFYKMKTGINKAAAAENAIYVLKRKLFMMLRHNLSHDWPRYLLTVTKSLNLQPRPALGYMSPSQIQSPVDDPTLREAKKHHNVAQAKEPDIETKFRNQAKFEASKSPFQVGNYVYKNFLPHAFDKSFDTQVM